MKRLKDFFSERRSKKQSSKRRPVPLPVVPLDFMMGQVAVLQAAKDLLKSPFSNTHDFHLAIEKGHGLFLTLILQNRSAELLQNKGSIWFLFLANNELLTAEILWNAGLLRDEGLNKTLNYCKDPDVLKYLLLQGVSVDQIEMSKLYLKSRQVTQIIQESKGSPEEKNQRAKDIIAKKSEELITKGYEKVLQLTSAEAVDNSVFLFLANLVYYHKNVHGLIPLLPVLETEVCQYAVSSPMAPVDILFSRDRFSYQAAIAAINHLFSIDPGKNRLEGFIKSYDQECTKVVNCR